MITCGAWILSLTLVSVLPYESVPTVPGQPAQAWPAQTALGVNNPADMANLQPPQPAPAEPAPLAAEPVVASPLLLDRLQQLEAQTQDLQNEVTRLRQQAVQPQPEVAPVAPSVADNVGGDDEYLTLDQLRAEMRKLVWTKGDFSIVPYGILWGTAAYETQRSNAGDYVFWVYPKNIEGENAFHCDGRSTRLGVDLIGPRIPMFDCAVSGGKVEIDFQRTFDTENRAGLLLRHAYAEVKNEEFRLLVGQTWDVISPLYPGMLMYSIGWGGGDIGYRRAQLRGERFLALSDTSLLTLQACAASDIITDSATNLAADHSGWPVLQARTAMTLGQRGPGCLPIEFGFSGHIGEQIFDFRAPTWANPVDDLPRRTWSLNFDMKIPLTERFGVQGEFFTGENLGAYYGGINQGVDIGTPAVPGTRRAIRSTGGWIDVWYHWTPRLHTHFGYGIDDPVNADVTGIPNSAVQGRIYNDFIFTNVSFDITKKWMAGVEVSYWKTLWKLNEPGKDLNTAFVSKYSF